MRFGMIQNIKWQVHGYRLVWLTLFPSLVTKESILGQKNLGDVFNALSYV